MSKNLLELIPIEEYNDFEKFENEIKLNFLPSDLESSFFYSLQPQLSQYLNSLFLYNEGKDIKPVQNKIKIIPIWKEKVNISINHLTPYLLKNRYGLDNFISIQMIRMDDYDGNYFHPVRLGFENTNGYHFLLKDIVVPYMKQVPIKCKSLNSVLGNQSHYITQIGDLNLNLKYVNKDYDKLYIYMTEGEYRVDELLEKIVLIKNRLSIIYVEYELYSMEYLVRIFEIFGKNEIYFDKVVYSGLNTGLIFIFSNIGKLKKPDFSKFKLKNLVYDCWNRWLGKKDNSNKLIKRILETELFLQSIKFPDFLSCHINQYVSSGFKEIDFGSYKKLLPKNFSFFPDRNDVKKNRILISDFSMRYISKPDMSQFITDKIKERLGDNIVITDAMANVGGNTINFVNSFKFVNAIEINKVSFDCLKNNVELYADKDNYKLYNANYLEMAEDLVQDVVFIDPPWGGSFYKYYSSLHIHFNSVSLSTLVSVLKTRYVVLKLPFNMNLQRFLLDVNYKESTILFFQNIFIVILRII